MTFEARIQALIDNLTEAKADAAKIDAGQAGAPGKRLRAVCGDTQKECLQLRKDVLAVRKGD